jgi:hypothetical protein
MYMKVKILSYAASAQNLNIVTMATSYVWPTCITGIIALLERAFTEEDTASLVDLVDVLRILLPQASPGALSCLIEVLTNITDLLHDEQLVSLLGAAVDMQAEVPELKEAAAPKAAAHACKWKVDQIVDCLDDSQWCAARIIHVYVGASVWYYVHYEEWKAIHNRWVQPDQIREFNGRAYVPHSVWKCTQASPRWDIGDIVGARDRNRNWWISRVLAVHVDPTYPRPWYLIHYEGWPHEEDEWISSSLRVRPYYANRDRLLIKERSKRVAKQTLAAQANTY